MRLRKGLDEIISPRPPFPLRGLPLAADKIRSEPCPRDTVILRVVRVRTAVCIVNHRGLLLTAEPLAIIQT